MSGKILVVDDTAANVKLLADLLTVKGYTVSTASTGEEALVKIAGDPPDLVLLDIMMPGMSGYDVCRTIRANPATTLLPVILCTSLDPHQERVKGMEAGADDFLTKPVNQPELFARVKSLLRVKSLQDEVKRQAEQLASWNQMLEARVAAQVAEVERLAKLKRFVSPRVGDLILAGEVDDPLKARRRDVTIVFTDLRGFTAFTENAEPEEVMGVLREYHEALGNIVLAHEGTIEHFEGDGVMVIFNDPVVMDAPELAAIRMSLELRDAATKLCESWRRQGHALGFAVGIASGYATLGAIGFEGRRDYGAIGSVTNLSARLCSEARAGQVLISERVHLKVEAQVKVDAVGELELKGFARPVPAFNVLALGA